MLVFSLKFWGRRYYLLFVVKALLLKDLLLSFRSVVLRVLAGPATPSVISELISYTVSWVLALYTTY